MTPLFRICHPMTPFFARKLSPIAPWFDASVGAPPSFLYVSAPPPGVRHTSIDDFLITTPYKKQHGLPLELSGRPSVSSSKRGSYRFAAELLHDWVTAQMGMRLALRSLNDKNAKSLITQHHTWWWDGRHNCDSLFKFPWYTLCYGGGCYHNSTAHHLTFIPIWE